MNSLITVFRRQIHISTFGAKLVRNLETMTKQKQNVISTIKETLRGSVSKSVSKHAAIIPFKTGPGDYAEHDKFLGLTNPFVRNFAKNHINLSLNELQSLLESEYNEERFLALIILAEQYKNANDVFAEEIYQFYLTNTAHVNNWNLVDTSAHLIVGAHLVDKDRSHLIELARSPLLWERRIAIVSTLQFIRNKDLNWTFKLAELLLTDDQDLIHKAVGWMMREAGKKDVVPLLSFLDAHAAVMPRVMLRYSLEKLDAAQKKHYMGLKKLK
jgi:3-methyladenine DNA glycosylase AlkD